MGTADSAVYADVSEFDLEIANKEKLDQKDTFRWTSNTVQKSDLQFTSVTIVDEPKEWLRSFIKQLTQLSTLDDDWDSYGAEAPNQWAIYCAREILKNLSYEDFKPSSIDASVEGGVCISFQTISRYGDIECFNTGEVFAVISKNGEDTEVWEITEFQIAPAIKRIQSYLHKLS